MSTSIPKPVRARRYLLGIIGLAGLVLVVALFNQSADAPLMEVKPDADGKLTYRGPGYQFRVWPKEVALTVLDLPKGDPYFVSLSIDRTRFGASEAPGESPITCQPDGSCSSSCSGGRPCYDLINGWYRVGVLPVSNSLGSDPRALNLGPIAGTGFSCADVGRPKLELCWDPTRINPPEPLTNVRSVSYPAIKQAAAYVWISTARDVDGRPTFIADCAVDLCHRNIERDGARLEITFHARELDDWQRFEAGLQEFAAKLIEPLPSLPSGKPTH